MDTIDVMQVCRNGHVITELLKAYPERGMSHCDRCGADTLDRCPTCGQDLPGARVVPGLVPVGASRAPLYCSACGAPFPWAERPAASSAGAVTTLEALLRRLPRVVRQLRNRQGDRPPFRVDDERDLEDLLRALLPLHFDDIRPESRTPSYASGTRTDFLLAPEGIAVVAKLVVAATRADRLAAQWAEDVAYYARHAKYRIVAGLAYDPGQRLREPRDLERTWSRAEADVQVRCLIVS